MESYNQPYNQPYNQQYTQQHNQQYTQQYNQPPSRPLRYEKRNSGAYRNGSQRSRPAQSRPGPRGSGSGRPVSRDSRDNSKRSSEPWAKDPKLFGLKNHFVAATGEFVGTTLFLWFAFAWHQTVSNQTTNVAANGGPLAQTVLFIGLGYGFSLLVNAWAFYRISGGLFNPAVLLCLVLTGSLPAVRALFLFPAELLGGISAAALVSCMFPGDIAVVNTLIASDTSIVSGVFIEMFLTSLLLFVILMLAAEKSKATFVAPIGIGLALFVAELAGVYYTGGSLNPARSFGPAVASLSFPTYHWIYWVGPGLGALMAAGYYHFVKWLNYEEANPGQDSAGGEFVSGPEEV